MKLEIAYYGNPVLRRPGAAVTEFDENLRELAAAMMETMRKHDGVGLAAHQVGRALQLYVVDVRPAQSRPSVMEIDGREVRPEDRMPLVLINSRVKPFGPPETGVEGCLSFPEIYADIARPARVEVEAADAEGRSIRFRAGGLLSRAIQHEYDHTRGILFIDRMDSETKEELRPRLEALRRRTAEELKKREQSA